MILATRSLMDKAVAEALERWQELPRQMPYDLSLLIRSELDKVGLKIVRRPGGVSR